MSRVNSADGSNANHISTYDNVGLAVTLANTNEFDAEQPGQSSPPPSSTAFAIYSRSLLLGLSSASPTLLLIGCGAKASVWSVFIYVVLLLATTECQRCNIESGVGRWFLGCVLLLITSSYKSGYLLTSCDSLVMKGALYAITALWECSNAVLVIGGKNLLEKRGLSRDGSVDGVLLQTFAPCQVKFVQLSSDCSPRGQFVRRSIHIVLSLLSIASLYFLVVRVQPVQTIVTSFVLFELEFLALMTSLAVVVLDIPSHLWQLIHDLLVSTPYFSQLSQLPQPRVILPYGWIYSSKSTREFWSRWSRPAMQLIRHLFYYPLGGRRNWYVSIPVTFLLNASGHFDLSYALVGDKSEVYWIAFFGTLALIAMLEVAGDGFFAVTTEEGNSFYPAWYIAARTILAHAILRAALYIMVHMCFKTSLNEMMKGQEQR